MKQWIGRGCATLAVASLLVGLALSAAHPRWPVVVTLFFFAATLLFVWKPRLGLPALSALLPVLNFSPWTGWLIVEEFDLLVLAVLSAGYFRIWRSDLKLRHVGVATGLTVMACFLIWRGADGLSWPQFNGFAGYDSPLNTVRVGKSLLWVGLLSPLLLDVSDEDRRQSLARFFRGTVLGSVWVVLGVLWERSFYPGLMDVQTPYRTVGLFWEMHHGGAALDVYLVLVAPLLVWLWRQTSSAFARVVLGIYVLAFVYACLTTFSRGMVFAASGAVIVQGMLYVWQRYRKSPSDTRFGSPSSALMLALIGAEVVTVFAASAFMSSRLQDTAHDFHGRLKHWQQAVSALQTPTEWLFGIGLGRFPSHDVQRGLGSVVPGRSEAVRFSDGITGVVLSGPEGLLHGGSPGRFFALSQRVEFVPTVPYQFFVKVRGVRSGQLVVQLCASHLLYPARCSARILNVAAGGWQERRGSFPPRVFSGLDRGPALAGRVVLLISVLTPGASFEITELHLGAGGRNVVANPRFQVNKGAWFPQSFRYFQPWHIDNLYLELLVETGIAGLIAFLGGVWCVLSRLWRSCRVGETLANELLSCTLGVLVLGSVVSILDMPRAAWLMGMILICGLSFGRTAARHSEE